MITITHSEDVPIMDILILIQKYTRQEGTDYPIRVIIGDGTFKIHNENDATFFSLGIMACLDAKVREAI